MKYKNLFWGIVLILLGVMYLLKKLDIIWFSWRDIVSLWPLLLVLWGISLLPMKSLAKLIVSLLAIAAMVILIYFNPGKWNSGWIWIGEVFHTESNGASQSIHHDELAEFATLELKAAAGTYTISETTDKLLDFTHKGDSGTYYKHTSSKDNYQHIRIGPEGKNNQFQLYRSHEVDIKLNPETVWELDIDAGAAEVYLDLSSFVVNEISINGGAAAIELILGSKSDSVNVIIETGVSTLLVKVPEDFACEISTDIFLSSNELPGFDKVSSSTYVSPNFATAERNIYISFESAISSFKVIRYKH